MQMAATVAANLGEILAAFNSAKEKPLPSLTLALCCCVWHRTSGRNLSAGLGAFAAALAALLSRRDFFLPGWLNQDLMWRGPRDDVCHFLWKCWLGMILLCLTMVLYAALAIVAFVVTARARLQARRFLELFCASE